MPGVILKCRTCGDLKPLNEASKNTIDIRDAKGWRYDTENGWRCPKHFTDPTPERKPDGKA
jgi:hypothetical protein